MKKNNKGIIIFLISLAVIFFIVIIVTSVLLYKEIQKNNSISNELDDARDEYQLLVDEKEDLSNEHDYLKSEYDELFLKSQILPEKPEDFIELALKLDKSHTGIMLQILYINYLKTKNNYVEKLSNLNNYINEVTIGYTDTFSPFWQDSISLEKDTWLNWSNLDRKLSTGQISKSKYDTEWKKVSDNYNSESRRLMEEYNQSIKDLNEKYLQKINEDSNNLMNEINSTDKESDERFTELFEIFKNLNKEYGIDEVIVKDEDCEIFGVKELTDKYKDEINDLEYPIIDE